MVFHWSSLLLAILFAALSWTAARLTRRHEHLWCRLPRQRHAGFCLGLVCLLWAATEANLMLEGDLARFHALTYAAAPVIAVLAFFHLDFLFARALGGSLLLLLTNMLHQAFADQLRARVLFALVAYAVCIGALALVATPWYFRDLLERTANSAGWRHATTAALALISVSFAVYAVLSWAPG